MSSPDGSRREGLWDPAEELTRGSGRLFWLFLCLGLVVVIGPSFFSTAVTPHQASRPDMVFFPDFFQDYASARNFKTGLHVYTDHSISAPLYLPGHYPEAAVPERFRVNAHPPSSILLFLPLAGLDFATAFRVWNLLSLTLLAIAVSVVVRELGLPWSVRAVAPALALTLLCYPLWVNILNSQFSPILALLFAITWAAERDRRPVVAGVSLALAIAIKLFPLVLLLYYALRKRWAVVGTTLFALLLVAAVTSLAFGIDVFNYYYFKVMPQFSWFRSSWLNASVSGFWSRLFDTAPEVRRDFHLTRPVLYSPRLALLATVASDLLLLACFIVSAVRARSVREHDLAFCQALAVMLLISPITWPHYLVILVLAYIIAWPRGCCSASSRWLLLALSISTACFSPDDLISRFADRSTIASPIFALTVLSIEFYILLTFYAVLLFETRALCTEGQECPRASVEQEVASPIPPRVT